MHFHTGEHAEYGVAKLNLPHYYDIQTMGASRSRYSIEDHVRLHVRRAVGHTKIEYYYAMLRVEL